MNEFVNPDYNPEEKEIESIPPKPEDEGLLDKIKRKLSELVNS
jgi:hypothetical protein